jgi:CubicO group peptidase (beta-lactamase class C family)
MRRTLLSALACVSLSGCVPDTLSPAVQQQRAGSFEDARLSIDGYIADEMARRHISGLALAVIQDGRLFYAKGYGFADLDLREPVREDTPFLIASITKMFTATATMMLVRDGKLRLDDAAGDYLDNIPAHWRPLTVRQLLSHTSGLDSHTSSDAGACGPRPEESKYTKQDVVAEIACLPLKFAPGSDWFYSDTGYFVLGLLIERVSGLAYEEFLRREVFMPLGMSSTRLIGPIGARDGRATGYSFVNGRYQRGPSLSPVVEGASGGLVSNVVDLAKFDRALARGDLLPASTLAKMWEPVVSEKARYGLGFGLRPVGGRRQAGHTGGGPSAATSFARFLDDGLTVIVLTNTGQPPGTIQDLVGGIATRFNPVVGERRRSHAHP